MESRAVACDFQQCGIPTSADPDKPAHYIDFWCIYRGGSRISGKGVHMYKDAGFAFLILSHFS